jgi:hypothetical protein
MNRIDATARDWPALANEAARLHAARQRHADQLAQAEDAGAAKAADRARVMQALATMWRAIVDRVPVPELPACHAEIRQDLQGIRATLAARVSANAAEANAAQLARIDALIAHHHPWWPGCDGPHILFLHQCNLEARRRWPRPEPVHTASLKEGGDHVDRSAGRAPLRQAAAHKPRAAATTPHQQTGLF